jgi:hypothetical protein
MTGKDTQDFTSDNPEQKIKVKRRKQRLAEVLAEMSEDGIFAIKLAD